ncbi:MAG: hypothetical protein GX851_08575 [Clostridiales bacterium]|nr:hypothetical protein [Clostridiales bacterium]
MEKYIIIAVAVLVLAVAAVLWKKALESGRRAREIKQREIEYIEREKHLRESFRELTDEKISTTGDDELLFGAGMNIQLRIEKAADMTAAFLELPVHEQYIYTLSFFADDVADALSEFYRKNGEPLISLATGALKAVGEDKAGDCARRMYPMFDGENEEVSFDKEKVEAVDGDFRSDFDRARFLKNCASYIRTTF